MQDTELGIQCTAIFAADRDFLIGFNTNEEAGNQILRKPAHRMPWKNGQLQDDMAFFRQTTKDQWLLMGRKTLESIGCLLPKRLHLVFSRNQELQLGEKVLRQCRDLTALELAQLLQVPTAGLLLQDWQDLNRLIAILQKDSPRCAPPPIFLIGGAELLTEARKQKLLYRFYFTQVDAQLSHQQQPNESPVFLDPQLCQLLSQKIPQSKLIQLIHQNQQNLYNARIYCITL